MATATIAAAVSTPTATIIAAATAVLGGAVATLAGHLHNSRTTFFEALRWLEGGTQRRSLGIATIEAVWRRRRPVSARLFGNYGYFRDLSIPVLESAAVYLLLEKAQTLEAHEMRNLERIMELLVAVKGAERKRHSSVYDDLAKALGTAKTQLEEACSTASGRQPPDGPASNPNERNKRIIMLQHEAKTLEKSARSLGRHLGAIEPEPDQQALKKLLESVKGWCTTIKPT